MFFLYHLGFYQPYFQEIYGWDEILSKLELASRAGGSGWAGPTSGQRNNRADRAGPDLNRAAILLTQPGPISG